MNYVIPLTIFIIVVIAFQLFRERKPKQLSEEEKLKIKERQKKESEKWNLALENDPDRITNEDIRSLIPTLGLSKNVLELFDGKCEDDVMKSHFFDKDYADPNMVISLLKYQQDAYLVDRYKPIIAYAGASVFAYDSKLKGYISYDIESHLEQEEECLTWDGLFVGEVLRWWEHDISEEDIIHIGDYFGLKHTKEILDSIIATTDGKGFATGKEITAWENSMIDKINGLIR